MELPSGFTRKMKLLLGQEYEAFAESYDKERALGIRRNPLKIEEKDFPAAILFGLTKCPWAQEGYYYSSDDRPCKHPYHEAGLYYIQEPSAMAWLCP